MNDELHRLLFKSDRDRKWAFPGADGTSVISKYGRFWIDTNDMSVHKDDVSVAIDERRWGIAATQPHNVAHVLSAVAAGVYSNIIEDIDAVALFPYPQFAEYDEMLEEVPREYASQIEIPLVYCEEPSGLVPPDRSLPLKPILSAKTLEVLGFETKLLSKMYSVKSQMLRRLAPLDNPLFDKEIVKWQSCANALSALHVIFGREVPFPVAADVIEGISYGQIHASDIQEIEKTARDADAVPMMCRFIDFSPCVPAFSADIIQDIQIVIALWEKNLALSNLSLSLAAAVNSNTKVTSIKSLQEVGRLLGIDAMVKAHFSGVPAEDICPDWQVTRMPDGQLVIIDKALDI